MSKHGINLAALKIPQPGAFNCHVMVWKDGAEGQAEVLPGHCSLLLRRPPNEGPWSIKSTNLPPPYDPALIRYVSFWERRSWGLRPIDQRHKNVQLDTQEDAFAEHHLLDYEGQLGEDAALRLCKGGASSARQIVMGRISAVDMWGLLPSKTVSLPGLDSTRPTALGLNLNRIVSWAIGFKKGPEYDADYLQTTQNCAGVAVRALCAGGADAFGQLGGNKTDGTLYMTPDQALLWVEGVARGIREVNHCLSHLNTVQIAKSTGTDLPSVSDWKKSSDGVLHLRGRAAHAIDEALADYHAANWNSLFPQRLAALVTIVRKTRDLFAAPGLAKRAYRDLAGCILSAIGTVSGLSATAWDPTSYYGKATRKGFSVWVDDED